MLMNDRTDVMLEKVVAKCFLVQSEPKKVGYRGIT